MIDSISLKYNQILFLDQKHIVELMRNSQGKVELSKVVLREYDTFEHMVHQCIDVLSE